MTKKVFVLQPRNNKAFCFIGMCDLDDFDRAISILQAGSYNELIPAYDEDIADSSATRVKNEIKARLSWRHVHGNHDIVSGDWYSCDWLKGMETLTAIIGPMERAA